MINRECPESPVTQAAGTKEAIAYSVTVPSGRSPLSSLSNKIYDITDADNITETTSTMMSGSASASGLVYTTKKISGLVSGQTYRVDCQYTDTNGNTFCPFFRIQCK
jgi:hypothetical protein